MFGWIRVTLYDPESGRAVQFSYIAQRYSYSCVVTCLAILTWNCGHGLGFLYAAESAGYAVSADVDQTRGVGNFYSMPHGIPIDDVDPILRRCGFNQTQSFRNLSQCFRDHHAISQSSPVFLLRNRIQGMRENDAMLILIPRGSLDEHCLLLIVKNNCFVLLDPDPHSTSRWAIAPLGRNIVAISSSSSVVYYGTMGVYLCMNGGRADDARPGFVSRGDGAIEVSNAFYIPNQSGVLLRGLRRNFFGACFGG